MLDFKKALQNPEIQYLRKTENGVIKVLKNQQFCWLCLNETVQTVMDLSTPSRLVLPHLHALALAFYFKPNAHSITELGLGGGAMPRHIMQHLPQASVLSIELEPTIISCFNQFFSIEDLGSSHTVKQEDAYEFMQQGRPSDIVLVDLFGEKSTPAFLNQQDFYQNCFSSLGDDGLLVLNLLPNHPFQAEQLRRMLHQLSGQKTMLLSIPGYKNRIIFASQQQLPALRYTKEVVSFAQAQGVDLNSFIQMS
ncbi:hypothetical protein EYS14_20460 [Alteromonadaceae bacterium M269]|nr:hypothetical protein EYS14_20460 [Alteromonadaceae bacterium M269]